MTVIRGTRVLVLPGVMVDCILRRSQSCPVTFSFNRHSPQEDRLAWPFADDSKHLEWDWGPNSLWVTLFIHVAGLETTLALRRIERERHTSGKNWLRIRPNQPCVWETLRKWLLRSLCMSKANVIVCYQGKLVVLLWTLLSEKRTCLIMWTLHCQFLHDSCRNYYLKIDI